MKIGIAGAGIMGRLLAYAFRAEGCDVTVFAGSPKLGVNSCSEAAAGMLLPVSELQQADYSIYMMGKVGITQWPEIIQDIDPAIYFRQLGSLVLAHPRDKSDLQHFVALIQSKFSKQHESTTYNPVHRADLHALEPELTRFDDGYFIAEEGQIDNQTLLSSLKTYLITHGVKWLNEDYHFASGGEKFDLTLDCRGLGAKTELQQLYAVRGECVWLHAPNVLLNRPIRLMHPRYPLYVVPRPNNVYIVGASEIVADDHSPISVRTLLELLTAVYSIHPGFSEARVIKSITQCRPTFPTHLPQIKHRDGVLFINGLYRHGFLIAPAIMMEVLNWFNHGLNALRFPEIWSDT